MRSDFHWFHHSVVGNFLIPNASPGNISWHVMRSRKLGICSPRYGKGCDSSKFGDREQYRWKLRCSTKPWHDGPQKLLCVILLGKLKKKKLQKQLQAMRKQSKCQESARGGICEEHSHAELDWNSVSTHHAKCHGRWESVRFRGQKYFWSVLKIIGFEWNVWEFTRRRKKAARLAFVNNFRCVCVFQETARDLKQLKWKTLKISMLG